MAKFFAHMRFIAGALALAFVVAIAAPAPVSAQGGPTRGHQRAAALATAQGGVIAGQVSIPDKKAAKLIHPAGREWREFRTVTLQWIGGIAILGMLVLLALYYHLARHHADRGMAGRDARFCVSTCSSVSCTG